MGVTLSVVAPLYNEQEVIRESYKRLREVLEQSGESYELIFVNDGSRDDTWRIVTELAARDPHLKLVSFSRNFGHQAAISAGMDLASGEAVVVIDADLQDPPTVILEMLAKWREGYEVVYGRRTERKGETWFKKTSAKAFYRILNALTDVELPVDAGDFRLLDKAVCRVLRQMPERNRYVRGLVSWVGFRQCSVEYVREERFAGVTKYPLRKMLKLAADALTSFSYKPLRLSITIGALVSFFSFAYLLVIVCQRLFTDHLVEGWATLAGLMLLFNGLVLLMLGIIGQYVGRIYDEAKGRPNYIVAKTVNMDEDRSAGDE